MTHKLPIQTSFLGPANIQKSSSAASELYHRTKIRSMDRHGSATPPRQSPEDIYPNDANNVQYPPSRPSGTALHQRNASVSSVKSTGDAKDVPRIYGLPLKYVSLVTLALQNASLAIIMHYSRITVAPDKVYSASAAVLMNEILKGSISFLIAFTRVKASSPTTRGYDMLPPTPAVSGFSSGSPADAGLGSYLVRLRTLISQIASADSWKLGIPALLYVLQNNLQYIAVSNLEVPTFQVTNQMKILTTAGFSVLLLRKRLTGWKWASLALLTIGVGIVQIQASAAAHTPSQPIQLPEGDLGGDSVDPAPEPHPMHPLTGFLAVSASCFTSGLAGVYFEMVLKGTKADLWVRNVQLSLWSLIPALIPVLIPIMREGAAISTMFANFGFWAWCTVLTQVFGGLVTALVIKYSDNILKGFATSLSIVLSFLASVAIFDVVITPSFVLGATVVLGATWMYNSPDTVREAVNKEFGQRDPVHLSGEDVSLLNGTRKSTEQDDDKEQNYDLPTVSPVDSRAMPFGYPAPSDSKPPPPPSRASTSKPGG